MKIEQEERGVTGLSRRRLLASVGIGGLGVTILAACGTGTTATMAEPEAKEEMKEEKQAEAAPVAEEVTLRYYSWFSERDQGNVESVMFEPFAEANPGATVELLVPAPGELWSGQGLELTTMLAGGVLSRCIHDPCAAVVRAQRPRPAAGRPHQARQLRHDPVCQGRAHDFFLI